MASSNGYIPSKNQVAGHRFEEGRVGSLVDGKGLFFKPLQGDERGEREVAFYQQFWGDESVPANIKAFFPKFYGVKELEAAGPVGKIKHAALEDLTHSYVHPSIVDIKMGKQTWYPGCSKEYEEKCRAKDATTPSPEIGFRISGMQVFDPKTGETWRAAREWGKGLDAWSTSAALKRFIAPADDKQSRRTAADRIRSLLAHLHELQRWFESQQTYHFYSASLLLMYDSPSKDNSLTDHRAPDLMDTTDGAAKSRNNGATESETSNQVEVRLIDFAHVIDGKGNIDSNFLSGLQILIERFTELLSEVANSR
jgi:1D-myo-inositol-tetrakisphosphate 5-kinase/inositol-polyphosphate multikinase